MINCHPIPEDVKSYVLHQIELTRYFVVGQSELWIVILQRQSKEVVVNVIKIIAVGDMMFGDSHIKIGSGVRSQCRKMGYDFPFLHVKHIFEENKGIIIGNLECALSSAKTQYNSKPYVGDLEIIDSMCDIGFNVVNMANNHIFEYGKYPALETQEELLRRKILPIGLPNSSLKEGNIKISGISMGFLGFSLVPTLKYDYFEHNKEYILQSVRKSVTENDIVIVSIHWGAEFVDFPSQQQIQFGHNLIDNGAKVVLGHHPHVRQPIEFYKSGLIVYSLGNFVFDSSWNRNSQLSMLLLINIPLTKDDNITANALPIEINGDYQPIPDKTIESDISEFNKTIAPNFEFSKLNNQIDRDYSLIASMKRNESSRKLKRYILKHPHRLSLLTYRYLFEKRVRMIANRNSIPEGFFNTSWDL